MTYEKRDLPGKRAGCFGSVRWETQSRWGGEAGRTEVTREGFCKKVTFKLRPKVDEQLGRREMISKSLQRLPSSEEREQAEGTTCTKP